MKQFIPQVGGHFLRLDDFVVIEQAYAEAFSGIISAFDPTGTCILTGIRQSGTSTLSFTKGYVAFLGETFVFPAQTLSYVFGGRLFLKIKEEVIVPSSPVPYEDTLNKNIHFDRTMYMKYFDAGDGDVNGVNGIYYDSINWASVFQKGMVIEFYPTFPGEENTLFDSNGLGVGRMKGWQVCNGLGGSPDLRGQFTFMPSVGMFNPAGLFPNVVTGISISQRTGAATRVITTANLPAAPVTLTMDPHTHTTNPHNHPTDEHGGHSHVMTFAGGDSDEDESGTSPNYMKFDPPNPSETLQTTLDGEPNIGSIKAKVLKNTTGLTVLSNTVVVNANTSTGTGVVAGGGAAFTTVPPGFSMIKILKIS